MSDKIKHVTDTSFNSEVLQSPIPVLVDYWAEWCGPCKMIGPSLEEISKDYAGRLKVVKLNVDDAPETARRFEVMSIPTLILFKDGEPSLRIIGAKGKGQLIQEIDPFL
jgi:thioredoxin 1